MTTKTSLKPRRAFASALAATLLLLPAGCLEKHLVWSPDGQRAAVIAKDGLHLCDIDGHLTPPLLPGVSQVTWLGDSQRLVVAREREIGDWTPIAQALGPERATAVAAQADAVWKELETGSLWSILAAERGEKTGQAMRKIYLRERYGDALRAKVSAGDWDDLKSKRVKITEVLMARISGGQIQPGTQLHEGFEQVHDIRLSPDNRTVAFTTDVAPDNDDECHLWLARIDATGATTVAEGVNSSPDWTADGRSLVYVQASGGEKSDLRLGTLVRREVRDESSQIKIGEKPDDLAGLLFQNSGRVRCLKDGRILFNTVEFSLPVTAKDADVEGEKLFVLDAQRQSTLVRIIPRGEEEDLPKNLSFFEVSPDEKQVLIGGYEGEVSVLTLVTGDVERLQRAGEYNLMAAPVWRQAGEITFARRNPAADGKEPARKAEIVRRKVVLKKGDKETVLSQGWSDKMLEDVFSGSSKK